ncbi:MAG: squalene synthase HpnC [Gemmataceae bacterium]
MTWDFRRQLAALGPGSRPAATLPAARRYCRWAAHAHYENFSVASLLLPRRLLPHFHAVYAYCRWADDLGDETGDRAPELLAWWRGELLACYAGEATHPVFVALRETVRHFGIPPTPFLDLLSAFEQDQHVKRYDTYEQLRDYCRRSADPVGRLVLYLFGHHDEMRGALSDAICTALQEANFWQDVARDLAIGRVYLPTQERARFGVTEDDLAAGRATPAFRELLRFEVERTRAGFRAGEPLVGLVPDEFRPDLELFVAGGRATLDRIEAAGYDVLTARPALSKWDKGKLVLAALGRKAVRLVGWRP